MTGADLVGMALSSVLLPSTLGGQFDPSKFRGLAAFIIYPYTGKPGIPDPPGWDGITGAHGSTPQLLSYKALHGEFQKRGVTLCGISFLSIDWQQDFAQRNSLSYVLLSDKANTLAAALGLETFHAGGQPFLRRRTLMARDGLIVHDRQNVVPPERDAAKVLSWLEAQQR